MVSFPSLMRCVPLVAHFLDRVGDAARADGRAVFFARRAGCGSPMRATHTGEDTAQWEVDPALHDDQLL